MKADPVVREIYLGA
ncbi:MAG TPA: hypothetical protein VEL75_18530 [Candidatus Methylomirabilis sp.]|nr:hypothetical protein [Candidatus Methylomirabilis sp.]